MLQTKAVSSQELVQQIDELRIAAVLGEIEGIAFVALGTNGDNNVGFVHNVGAPYASCRAIAGVLDLVTHLRR